MKIFSNPNNKKLHTFPLTTVMTKILPNLSKSINYTYRILILSGMETIGDHPKEKIECEFNDDSLDFKIHDFKGKNFRLKVSSLFDLIDPMMSIMRVK